MKILNKSQMECACGGKAKEISSEFHGFKARGWKCTKCGEEFLDPKDIEPILMLNKLQREGRLSFKVRRVGNSLSVTIPKEVVGFLGLSEKKEVKFELPNPELAKKLERKAVILAGS
jgi:hypothetical protein